MSIPFACFWHSPFRLIPSPTSSRQFERATVAAAIFAELGLGMRLCPLSTSHLCVCTTTCIHSKLIMICLPDCDACWCHGLSFIALQDVLIEFMEVCSVYYTHMCRALYCSCYWNVFPHDNPLMIINIYTMNSDIRPQTKYVSSKGNYIRM